MLTSSVLKILTWFLWFSAPSCQSADVDAPFRSRFQRQNVDHPVKGVDGHDGEHYNTRFRDRFRNRNHDPDVQGSSSQTQGSNQEPATQEFDNHVDDLMDSILEDLEDDREVIAEKSDSNTGGRDGRASADFPAQILQDLLGEAPSFDANPNPDPGSDTKVESESVQSDRVIDAVDDHDETQPDQHGDSQENDVETSVQTPPDSSGFDDTENPNQVPEEDYDGRREVDDQSSELKSIVDEPVVESNADSDAEEQQSNQGSDSTVESVSEPEMVDASIPDDAKEESEKPNEQSEPAEGESEVVSQESETDGSQTVTQDEQGELTDADGTVEQSDESVDLTTVDIDAQGNPSLVDEQSNEQQNNEPEMIQSDDIDDGMMESEHQSDGEEVSGGIPPPIESTKPPDSSAEEEEVKTVGNQEYDSSHSDEGEPSNIAEELEMSNDQSDEDLTTMDRADVSDHLKQAPQFGIINEESDDNDALNHEKEEPSDHRQGTQSLSEESQSRVPIDDDSEGVYYDSDPESEFANDEQEFVSDHYREYDENDMGYPDDEGFAEDEAIPEYDEYIGRHYHEREVEEDEDYQQMEHDDISYENYLDEDDNEDQQQKVEMMEQQRQRPEPIRWDPVTSPSVSEDEFRFRLLFLSLLMVGDVMLCLWFKPRTLVWGAIWLAVWGAAAVSLFLSERPKVGTICLMHGFLIFNR